MKTFKNKIPHNVWYNKIFNSSLLKFSITKIHKFLKYNYKSIIQSQYFYIYRVFSTSCIDILVLEKKKNLPLLQIYIKKPKIIHIYDFIYFLNIGKK